MKKNVKKNMVFALFTEFFIERVLKSHAFTVPFLQQICVFFFFYPPETSALPLPQFTF